MVEIVFFLAKRSGLFFLTEYKADILCVDQLLVPRSGTLYLAT